MDEEAESALIQSPAWPLLSAKTREKGYIASHPKSRWRVSDQKEGSTNKFCDLERALFGSEGALRLLAGGSSKTKKFCDDFGIPDFVVLKVRSGPVLVATAEGIHLLGSDPEPRDSDGVRTRKVEAINAALQSALGVVRATNAAEYRSLTGAVGESST